MYENICLAARFKPWQRTLVPAVVALLLGGALADGVHAVTLVGGQNGWEVDFDGNINQFYVTSDSDPLPAQSTGGTLQGFAVGAAAPNQNQSRVRSGLQPSLFSFSVKAPTINGLSGSARVTFAPQTSNSNTKNNPNALNLSGTSTLLGSGLDVREVFFNVEGDFGTVSLGRALSLFNRHNYLTDMTLFGVGSPSLETGGGTTFGRSGFGYVFPNFNSRISYKTPDFGGAQLEVGAFDPSVICHEGAVAGGGFANPFVVGATRGCATQTNTPRFEAEATYGGTFGSGNFLLWLGGQYQQAEFLATGTDVESLGFHGGARLGFGAWEFVASGYDGEALGTSLNLDADALDATGNERDHSGFIGQGTYTFRNKTRIGVSYGESTADETAAEQNCRLLNVGCPSGANESRLKGQSMWTVGVYHDVNQWLKLVAEYSNQETEWHGGEDHEVDAFSAGGFFFW